MKKFILILAPLAIFLSAILTSLKSKVSIPPETDTQSYVWVRYDCESWGTAKPATFSMGINSAKTTETNVPDLEPFKQFRNTGSNVYAVRFVAKELEPISGYYGHLRPKATVNPWDGSHLVTYCY